MDTNEVKLDLSDAERAAADFIRADFSECFQQMRHYDGQIMAICKFAFVGYTSITGAAIGLYKFGQEKHVNLFFPAMVMILIAFIVGFLLLTASVRYRFYFIKVVRYVDEIREHFLKYKPLGFKNKSRMWTDWEKIRFYNWRSSHLWVCYVIAFLNAVLLGSSSYIILDMFLGCGLYYKISVSLLVVLITLIGELLIVFRYLRLQKDI